MPISKLDLAALRKADAICFDHYRKDADMPVHRIRAIKRADVTERDPFAQDVTHNIDVNSVVYAHGDGAHVSQWTCFEMLHTAQYDDVWMTIVGLLKVGDELTLVWTADNNNGYVNEAGLHHDQLSLRVDRNGKRLTFKVRSSVCQNNTARTCRPAEYALA